MKKNLLIALGLVLVLAACNRKAFVKKLVGTYTLDKYLYDGENRTSYWDTAYSEWKLDIQQEEESNSTGRYTKTWKEYQFFPDTFLVVDTLGYDSVNMVYIIDEDTVPVVDTSVIPRMETGKWNLINSEEDLQFRNDSSNTGGEIYRILELKSDKLNLRKGNEELYLKK